MNTPAKITPQSQAEMSFVDHLEELRWHILRSLAAIAIIAVVAFLCRGLVFDTIIFGPKTTDFLTYKAFCSLSELLHLKDALCLQPIDFEVINVDMMGQFMAHLKISIIFGFILAFPYALWEMWQFIKPGLLENEQRYTTSMVSVSSFLFLIGILFGYFVLSPFSINFFAGYVVSEQVANTITLASYVGVISTLVLASGIMFELPMVVYFLSKMGMLTPELMRAYRRHAFIVILFVAAIITPADVWTQVLVSIPVYFLYEISIFVSYQVVKNQLKMEQIEKELDNIK